MTDLTNGPNGPRRFERSQRWQDVPPEVLRAWLKDQGDRLKWRGVASAVESALGEKLVHETIRKFAHSRGEPSRTTRRILAQYYLARHPRGYVAEKRPEYGPRPVPPLSEALPEGLDAARADVEKLIDLAKRFPNEVPASAERLRAWLETMLAAEYTGEDLSKRPLDASGNPVEKAED